MKLFWILPCALVLGLAACASRDGGPSATGGTASSPASADMLTAYHWQLRQAVDGQGTQQPQWLPAQAGAPVQLTFKDRRLSVTGLCNALGAGYATEGSKMSISQVMGTMKMCPDQALMQYEQRLGARLPQVASWSMDSQGQNPVLTLRFQDDARWLLDGRPTHETQYGSAGETLFLEVAPQRVPCSHPLVAGKQCLQVREVQYDDAGVKRGYGPWEAFYDDIEGYDHQAGARAVLRVKRYTRANPPADAPRHAYVMDMVVESEVPRSNSRP